MTITATWLKAQHKQLRDKTLELADRDGLNVRVSPKGKITYISRYFYNGMSKRVSIGSFPLMSLKEAREENQRLRAKLEQGHDPKVVRQTEKLAIMQAGTIEQLFTQWYDSVCITKKSAHQIKRSFELWVFPAIGKLPAESVTLHAWLDILEPLAKDKPMIASRILSNARQFLKWGVRRKLISSNPLSDITAKEDLQVKKNRGDRVLSDDEIKMVWTALDQSRTEAKNALFLKLCLTYACRCGELRLAEKSHFDFETGVWTVPVTSHKTGEKTGKPILRPITPSIEPFIKEAFALAGDSEYLFPNKDPKKKVMKPSFHLTLPYRLNVWVKRHLDVSLEHWSVHDLRRTARTNFSTLTEPHVAEIMLAHKLPGIWQVYDHHDYLEEQGQAYEAWCKRLFNIVGLKPANENVIEIKPRRRA